MRQDFRHAMRTLRRSPVFAASAILALALGMGANTAVFSVVYAVLLKPLPFERSEQLVTISERSSQGNDTGTVAAGTFVDWRARSRTFAGMAVFTQPGSFRSLWAIGDRLETVQVSGASPALFSILRVSPLLGRTFRPEPQQDRPSGDRGELVISYPLWQRLFGGAPDVVGRAVRIEDRTPARIVGVMPRGFAFPEGTEAWTNLTFVNGVPAARRRAQSFQAVGRLRPGVAIAEARRELNGIAGLLASEQRASNAGWTARVEPLAASDASTAKPALLALLGAVAGVLFIGCASVANLLLARASMRRRELAVRLALGAGRWRVARQCLAEALVLAALGTGAGVLLGEWLTGVLTGLAPPGIPRLGEVALNAPLLAFAVAAGLASAAFIGTMPAVQAGRADHAGALRLGTRATTLRGTGVRRVLIGGEVAVVVLLLTGAVLLVRTFVKLRGVDLGFRSEHVLVVSTRWPIGRVFPSTPRVRPWPGIRRAVDGLVETVASVPGVEAVGLIADVPLTGGRASGAVWRMDAPGASANTPPSNPRDRWTANLNVVTGGYFRAMGVPILRGRGFVDADRFSDEQLNDDAVPRSGVAIVNDAFARRYFPGEDPLGRTVVIYDDQTFGAIRTIVGVAGDVRDDSVAEASAPAVFLPHGQHPDVFVPSLIVRSALPIEAIAAPITARIGAVSPPLLVQGITPMDALVSGALSRPRFNLLLLGSFAMVALALSMVGIYGVLAYLVAQRTREIGIRMALGARRPDVVRLIMIEGMTPVAGGVAAGLLGGALATRGLSSMLYGVTPLDAVSFVAAPVLLAAVALLACYLPARRATMVDPLVALRDE